MSKAIREAEKRAREREEAKRKTMLKYYEPLPSPPPRHSSPEGGELRKLSVSEIEKFASRPNVRKIAVENFLATVHNNPDYYSAVMNLQKDAILYGWNPETRAAIREGIELSAKEGSSGNPDRKKLIELLNKLYADEFEAESKYRDAEKFVRGEHFTAVAASLSVIGDDEREHQRKLKNLIEQLEAY